MDKERNQAIENLKTAKNALAYEFNKLKVELKKGDNQYKFTNRYFNKTILKNIYGKTLYDIKDDLGFDEDDEFYIVKYMSIEHLKLCTDVIKKFIVEVQYKSEYGNTYDRVSSNLTQYVEHFGINAARVFKKQIDERNGKPTSIYTDLLNGIRENLKQEQERYRQREIKKMNSRQYEPIRQEDRQLVDGGHENIGDLPEDYYESRAYEEKNNKSSRK